MNIKNYLLTAFAKLGKKLFKRNPAADHFLIVSTTGLGDSLWATPAIRSLKESFPEAQIDILTSGVGAAVFKNNPHLNEIFVLGKPAFFSFLSLLRKMRRRSICTVLIFHTSQRPVLPLCYFLGESEVVGSMGQNKGLDNLLTNRVDVYKEHEIARRLRIVGAVGAQALALDLEVFLDPCALNEAEKIVGSVPSYIPLVALHPGAKDRYKQWPAGHFVKLGKQLQDQLGCQLIVTGSKEEEGLVKSVAEQLAGSIAIAGQLSVLGLAALYKRCALVIANDTGPMHLALSVQTPTVALFTPTDPLDCGPYQNPRCKVIAKERTCTPCFRKKCRDPFCLRQISVEEVQSLILWPERLPRPS